MSSLPFISHYETIKKLEFFPQTLISALPWQQCIYCSHYRWTSDGNWIPQKSMGEILVSKYQDKWKNYSLLKSYLTGKLFAFNSLAKSTAFHQFKSTISIIWKTRSNFYSPLCFAFCWLKPLIWQVNASIWQDVTYGYHKGFYYYCLHYSTFQSFPALHSRKEMCKALFLKSSQLKDAILHTYMLGV